MKFGRRVRRQREREAEAAVVAWMAGAMEELGAAYGMKARIEEAETVIAEARSVGDLETATRLQASVDQARAMLDGAWTRMEERAEEVEQFLSGGESA